MDQEKQRLQYSLLVAMGIVTLLWAVKIIEVVASVDLYFLGVFPRTVSGLIGIVTAPFIHSGWDHLFSNTMPLVVLLFILFNNYRSFAWPAFLLIAVLEGFWLWAAARPSYHIGASGWVYGLVAFLFMLGILRKDKGSVAISMLMIFSYGSLFWGILPVDQGISWEGHLMGGLAGIFVAFLYYKKDLPPKKQLPDEDAGLPYYKYEVEGELKQEYHTPSGSTENGQPPQEPMRVVYKFVEKDQGNTSAKQ